MKHKTYETLYKAHFGYIDKKSFEEAEAEENDPFYLNIFSLIIQNKPTLINWDVEAFTTKFRSGATPRERLDETVISFLLRLVDIHKQEQYVRTFRKPGSFGALMAWEAIFRDTVLCSLALLYDVEWSVETILKYLDPTVLLLLSGENDPLALRKLFESLGITVTRQASYKAEIEFGRLNFLYVGQFGSMYWRFLHWMAEAHSLRKNPKMSFYKKLWGELLEKLLYRTLSCGTCMYHFLNMAEEYKSQLKDPDSDFPKLFFEWHNRVHEVRRQLFPGSNEPNYEESEFEKDREFMRQALSPK